MICGSDSHDSENRLCSVCFHRGISARWRRTRISPPHLIAYFWLGFHPETDILKYYRSGEWKVKKETDLSVYMPINNLSRDFNSHTSKDEPLPISEAFVSWQWTSHWNPQTISYSSNRHLESEVITWIATCHRNSSLWNQCHSVRWNPATIVSVIMNNFSSVLCTFGGSDFALLAEFLTTDQKLVQPNTVVGMPLKI